MRSTANQTRPDHQLLADSEELPARPRARSQMESLPADQMEAELVDLTARMAAGTYELLVLVGELDSRGAWAVKGALSCAAWLADRCGTEVSTARTQVRVAKAMVAYPALDAAMARGDISYAKARVLVPYLSAANSSALLALAERNPAGRLGAAIAAWSQRNEDPGEIADRQHEARSVSWRTEPDGMVLITARLEPDVAAFVTAAIDLAVARANAPAGASLAQQRADAFASVMAGPGSAVAGTTGGGTTGGGNSARSGAGVTVDGKEGGRSAARAEVVIHVTEDGNRLPDGTPLSDNAVARLLPDAFVSLLMHDAQRQPVDASPRRRTPTRRQRRVIDARQGECQHPGCSAEVFLQYDHVEPYAVGGPTIIENLQRLCGPHNRARNRV